MKKGKRDLSPRLSSAIAKAALPYVDSSVQSILRKSNLHTSEDLHPKSGESWLDVINSLEVVTGRKFTSYEIGVLRCTIGAVTAESEPPRKKPKSLVDGSAQGQSKNPSTLSRKVEFYESKFSNKEYNDAEAAILQVTEAFANESSLIKEAIKIGKSPDDCKRMLNSAMKSTIRSPRTITMYAKHVMRFHDFLVSKEIPSEQRCGRSSTFHLFDFLETKAGTTVPATIRCALKTYGEVLGIDWPLDDKSIIQICEKPSKDPKTAPLLGTNHIKFFEKIACDENTVFGKRIYAAAFALMCHGSLRYDDTTTLESLERNETSILGKVSQPKVRSNDAKKFFCPRKGLENDRWPDPIFEFRTLYAKRRGFNPSYLFPDLSSNFTILESKAKKYLVQKIFRELLKESGEQSPEKFTLHSPRNWYVTVAAQLGWSRKAQTTLGRWGHKSMMPDHYNRQKGTIELAIRNDVVSRIKQSGWTPATGIGVPPPSHPH